LLRFSLFGMLCIMRYLKPLILWSINLWEHYLLPFMLRCNQRPLQPAAPATSGPCNQRPLQPAAHAMTYNALTYNALTYHIMTYHIMTYHIMT
jgi:hypothetical protein